MCWVLKCKLRSWASSPWFMSWHEVSPHWRLSLSRVRLYELASLHLKSPYQVPLCSLEEEMFAYILRQWVSFHFWHSKLLKGPAPWDLQFLSEPRVIKTILCKQFFYVGITVHFFRCFSTCTVNTKEVQAMNLLYLKQMDVSVDIIAE